jgi:unsaturated chondroitin disaccharide hydrolase
MVLRFLTASEKFIMSAITGPTSAMFSQSLDRMIGRVRDTARQIGEEFPYHADEAGKWITTSDGDWCGGHWIAMLWIAFRRTGEVFYRDLALRLTHRLAKRVDAIDMFRGVNHYYSVGAARRRTLE